MCTGDLTDGEWERLQPFLPPRKPTVGRPGYCHRRIIDGILWILRTGAPWRDLPARYGARGTVSSRFYRWCIAGIWERIWKAVLQQADQAGAIDWRVHYVDGSIVRAHQHAAGARATTPTAEALGRSRGGCSTKIHLKAEGSGKPLALVVTVGQRHEAVVFEELMAAGSVKRAGAGRPRSRPRRLVADKGYTSGRIRRFLRRRGIRATIPRRRNERRPGPFDRDAYRARNRVERLINRFKQYRRIATRYEKRAAHYRAMLSIVAIRLWLLPETA